MTTRQRLHIYMAILKDERFLPYRVQGTSHVAKRPTIIHGALSVYIDPIRNVGINSTENLSILNEVAIDAFCYLDGVKVTRYEQSEMYSTKLFVLQESSWLLIASEGFNMGLTKDRVYVCAIVQPKCSPRLMYRFLKPSWSKKSTNHLPSMISSITSMKSTEKYHAVRNSTSNIRKLENQEISI